MTLCSGVQKGSSKSKSLSRRSKMSSGNLLIGWHWKLMTECLNALYAIASTGKARDVLVVA